MTLEPRKDEPQQPQVSEPTAVEEGLGPILMQQRRRVLPLLLLGDDQRIDAKGTGTLVKLRGQPLVVTAAHVGDELRKAPGRVHTLVRPVEPDEAPTGRPLWCAPVVLELGIPVVSDPGLDFEVYSAPRWLAEDPRVDWYDGDQGARAAAVQVQTDWVAQRYVAEKVPFAVAGFGNHAHFTDESGRVERLGYQPLLCEVASWDPTFHTCPQITLIPDIDGETRPGLTSEEQAIAKRLDERSARDGEIVGGFSGGPVAVFGLNGAFLVGIVFEGGRVAYGRDVRIHARPWDLIVPALDRRSLSCR
jgi:hypothetical protein